MNPGEVKRRLKEAIAFVGIDTPTPSGNDMAARIAMAILVGRLASLFPPGFGSAFCRWACEATEVEILSLFPSPFSAN